MASDSASASLADAQPSTLPFNPADLVKMRVSPARFAKMCGVSRQSVSKWVKNGWIRPGPDGLLDPVAASRQYMDHVDPARMRARVFRGASASIEDMRARIQSLEAEVAATRAAVEAQCTDDFARRICSFSGAIITRFDEFLEAQRAGNGEEWLDALEGREVWRLDDAALREMQADLDDDSRETADDDDGECTP